jgi:hypothetical protein
MHLDPPVHHVPGFVYLPIHTSTELDTVGLGGPGTSSQSILRLGVGISIDDLPVNWKKQPNLNATDPATSNVVTCWLKVETIEPLCHTLV